MKRCPSCGEENADRARFCQSCATSLGGAETPAADVRKVVTIVFTDIAAPPRLASVSTPSRCAASWAATSTRWRGARAPRRHGREVHRRRRDGRVRGAGGCTRTTRCARSAPRSRCATRSRRSTPSSSAATGVRLALRIGVNTGEVVAGDAAIGPAARRPATRSTWPRGWSRRPRRARSCSASRHVPRSCATPSTSSRSSRSR